MDDTVERVTAVSRQTRCSNCRSRSPRLTSHDQQDLWELVVRGVVTEQNFQTICSFLRTQVDSFHATHNLHRMVESYPVLGRRVPAPEVAAAPSVEAKPQISPEVCLIDL